MNNLSINSLEISSMVFIGMTFIVIVGASLLFETALKRRESK